MNVGYICLAVAAVVLARLIFVKVQNGRFQKKLWWATQDIPIRFVFDCRNEDILESCQAFYGELKSQCGALGMRILDTVISLPMLEINVVLGGGRRLDYARVEIREIKKPGSFELIGDYAQRWYDERSVEGEDEIRRNNLVQFISEFLVNYNEARIIQTEFKQLQDF